MTLGMRAIRTRRARWLRPKGLPPHAPRRRSCKGDLLKSTLRGFSHKLFPTNPDAFLRKIPSMLLESFQARVARSTSAEVRARTYQFFWGSVASLKPSDLADDSTVKPAASQFHSIS